jgi:hypothetical protein
MLLRQFPRVPGQECGISLRAFLRESVLHDIASFFQAVTSQLAAAMSNDAPLKFRSQFSF